MIDVDGSIFVPRIDFDNLYGEYLDESLVDDNQMIQTSQDYIQWLIEQN
jgi:hypothetical protein